MTGGEISDPVNPCCKTSVLGDSEDIGEKACEGC